MQNAINKHMWAEIISVRTQDNRLLTIMDKQEHIHISTKTLSKIFCEWKLSVGVVVWVYKSLSDTECQSELLFI